MGKRKTIVCLETGKQFNSVENAANAIGVSSGFISRQIKAGKPIKGFYYYYAGEMLGCIDYIASVAYHGGILLKPITTEKEITGHIGDTILSWCEKGQKDDGGNEFRD